MSQPYKIEFVKTGRSTAAVMVDGVRDARLILTTRYRRWYVAVLKDGRIDHYRGVGVKSFSHSNNSYDTKLTVVTFLREHDPAYQKKSLKLQFKAFAKTSVRNGVDFVVRRKQLELIDKYVEFDCQFDCSTGLCKRGTAGRGFGGGGLGGGNGIVSSMNCCVHCKDTYGYFGNGGCDPEAVDFLIENFNVDTGFWREGLGCIIPRKWRSDTCSLYNCGVKDKPGMPEHSAQLFVNNLSSGERRVRKSMVSAVEEHKKRYAYGWGGRVINLETNRIYNVVVITTDPGNITATALEDRSVDVAEPFSIPEAEFVNYMVY